MRGVLSCYLLFDQILCRDYFRNRPLLEFCPFDLCMTDTLFPNGVKTSFINLVASAPVSAAEGKGRFKD